MLGDPSLDPETELMELELGERAAFALFHHDGLMAFILKLKETS